MAKCTGTGAQPHKPNFQIRRVGRVPFVPSWFVGIKQQIRRSASEGVRRRRKQPASDGAMRQSGRQARRRTGPATSLLTSSTEISASISLVSPGAIQVLALIQWQLWRLTSPWFRPGRALAAANLRLPLRRRKARNSRSKSGTPLLSGLGISWWTTALFVGTISWIYVLSVKPIKLVPQVRSVLLLGVFATTHSTSTALADGSRLVKCARWTTVNGSFRSMVTRAFMVSS